MFDIPLSQILETYGFPSLCLAVVALGVWRILRWTGNELLKPLFSQLIGLVKIVGDLWKKDSDNIDDIKVTMSRIESRQQEHFDVCKGATPLEAAAAAMRRAEAANPILKFPSPR